MEISFVYPDLDTDLFVDTVDSFNGDISVDNLRTFLPRTVVFVTLNVAVYIAWVAALWYIIKSLTYTVTARSVEIIGLSLFGYLLFIIFSFQGISMLKKRLRPRLLKALHGEDAKESYTLSAYVERKDGNKLVRRDVGFFKMCDTLKRSRILDASAVCDGEGCRVEVQFENEAESSVFTFYLTYHESDVDHVIVDLNRKCVIFPKEEKTDDEDENSK